MIVARRYLLGQDEQVEGKKDKGLLGVGFLVDPIDMEKYDFIPLDMKEKWVSMMRPDDGHSVYQQSKNAF